MLDFFALAYLNAETFILTMVLFMTQISYLFKNPSSVILVIRRKGMLCHPVDKPIQHEIPYYLTSVNFTGLLVNRSCFFQTKSWTKGRLKEPEIRPGNKQLREVLCE